MYASRVSNDFLETFGEPRPLPPLESPLTIQMGEYQIFKKNDPVALPRSREFVANNSRWIILDLEKDRDREKRRSSRRERSTRLKISPKILSPRYYENGTWFRPSRRIEENYKITKLVEEVGFDGSKCSCITHGNRKVGRGGGHEQRGGERDFCGSSERIEKSSNRAIVRRGKANREDKFPVRGGPRRRTNCVAL